MAKGTVNKVILLGRLGSDPELRTTQGGTTVATVSLATNDGWGDNEVTEWHRVTIFGKGAEVVSKYARKGSLLYIEGRLRTNKYQDKNGVTQYSREIIANDFQFVGGNNMQQSNFEAPKNRPAPAKNTSFNNNSSVPSFEDISSFNDDDIPF